MDLCGDHDIPEELRYDNSKEESMPGTMMQRIMNKKRNFYTLVGNVLFWNVFKIIEKKDMRYVLKTFWNVAETYREIEDMTYYLLHI